MFTKKSPYSFEVQIDREGRWATDGVFGSEEEARAYAQKALGSGKVRGIRVVLDFAKPDGTHVETEIHTEFCTIAKKIQVGAIEEAPPCATVDDLYSWPARQTLARLLRDYGDKAGVIPTEVLHLSTELKRVLDFENLAMTAVARVAQMQCPNDAKAAVRRREELNGFIDAVAVRARGAAARNNLPSVSTEGFAAAHARLAAAMPPDEARYFAHVVLGRALVNTRSLLGKFEILLALLDDAATCPAEPLALLDGVLAEVLIGPEVVTEILGLVRHQAEAIRWTLDLAEGKLAEGRRPAQDLGRRLNAALATGRLPISQEALIDVVRRQIRSPLPLVPDVETVERKALDDLTARLTRTVDLIGGSPMCEALLMRYGRLVPPDIGAAEFRVLALRCVLQNYPDAAGQIAFLLGLLDTTVGQECREEILNRLHLATDPDQFRQLFAAKTTIKATLERLAALYTHVVAGAALTDDERRTLADNLDEALCRYITANQVVERLDNPQDPLRFRAIRLVQLGMPGTLVSPKAQDLVRSRVLAHLRQPNFEVRYVAEIADPAAQQRALIDFHAMLRAAGFL